MSDGMQRCCVQAEPARFEPFIQYDDHGRTRFANRLIPVPLPLLRPERRQCRRKLGWRARSLHVWRITTMIEQAARVTGARRWLTCNPMTAHLMRVEDVRTPRARW